MLKAAKDCEQAAFLIEAMAEDRPEDLGLAYATALDVGPGLREHIANSLKRMHGAARVLENLQFMAFPCPEEAACAQTNPRQKFAKTLRSSGQLP